MRRSSALALAVLALGPLAGCGDDDDAGAASRAATLTVLAASSLTEAFTELGDDFEVEHPGVTVRFSFAGSSALAQQVNAGAPADVLATADDANMRTVVDAGNAGDPTVFARNRLSIIVEPGNPKGIRGLEDLARPDIVLVLCAPEVPCGKLAVAALAKAGVSPKPASLEENVKAVVSRVTLGEADAGIGYVTDVKAAGGKATGVDIAEAGDAALEAVYPIAVTANASQPHLARAWITLVQSPAGRAVLERSGFLWP